MRKKIYTCLVVSCGVLGTMLWQSCGVPHEVDESLEGRAVSAWKKGAAPGHLTIDYPKNGTLFPPEIPAPTFRWQDSNEKADTWVVSVALDDREEAFNVLVADQTWRPDSAVWETLKTHSVDHAVRVTVLGLARSAPEEILSSATTDIHTSSDRVGAPIFFRDVPLPFIYAVKNPDTIRWRLGDVGASQPPSVVLSDLPVCGNCHSFSRDGQVLGMDVDYANDKGSYAVTEVSKTTRLTPDRIITWSDYRREDGILTAGLLSQVSPDGRYVVSTVKDRSIFLAKDDIEYSQLFFPIRGILVVYDRETETFAALPGADDPRYVQSSPTWSPDGQYLIFARAAATHIPGEEQSEGIFFPKELAQDFLEGRRGFRYDLYRVPFNNGQGGTAEPIMGASNNEKSNYFPRISPDGKHLVFTMAENFMLLQPDSKLYIVPVAGGTPREMACNTSNMNSWHAFSPNGKWLVFSSKAGGPYTQLYLTHIDESGQDTPPVLLEHFVMDGRAANIPEFVNTTPNEFMQITESFIDDSHLAYQGTLVKNAPNASLDDLKLSVEYFKRALASNPANLEARISLGASYAALGEPLSAEQEYLQAVEAHPSDLAARNCLGELYMNTQQYPKALHVFQAIAAKWPDNAIAHLNLGVLYGATDNMQKAETHFQEAVRIEPNNFKALIAVGNALEGRGRPQESLPHYRKAIAHAPQEVGDVLEIAQRLMHREELSQEIAGLLRNLLVVEPLCAPAYVLLGKLCLRQNDLAGAIGAFETACALDPEYTEIKSKIAELKHRQGLDGNL